MVFSITLIWNANSETSWLAKARNFFGMKEATQKEMLPLLRLILHSTALCLHLNFISFLFTWELVEPDLNNVPWQLIEIGLLILNHLPVEILTSCLLLRKNLISLKSQISKTQIKQQTEQAKKRSKPSFSTTAKKLNRVSAWLAVTGDWKGRNRTQREGLTA